MSLQIQVPLSYGPYYTAHSPILQEKTRSEWTWWQQGPGYFSPGSFGNMVYVIGVSSPYIALN